MKKESTLSRLVLSLVMIGFCPVLRAGVYEKALSIDHTRVRGGALRGFPVFVSLSDPALKPVTLGGRVSSENGQDIYFALGAGDEILPFEIVSFDPKAGALKAWVRFPELSSAKDTEFVLRCGGEPAAPADGVWDGSYRIVEHFGDLSDPDLSIPRSGKLSFDRKLTVEAWVHSADARAEALQPLVSKWAPLESMTPESFSAYDAGKTDGMDCFMYYGAVFDGRYVYFCPIRSKRADRLSVHAHVLRYDTHKRFHAPESWEAYDAGATDGMKTVCYYGAVFDGRHVFFVPRDEGTGYHSRVLRYDTTQPFKKSRSWKAHDAGLPHSKQSAAFDGRYIYFCPGYDGTTLTGKTLADGEGEGSGKVLRLDTRGGFQDPESYKVFDAKAVSPNAVCFDGAAFDGRHVYFAPLQRGVALRYDTTADFENPDSWEAYDAGPVGMKPCVGAVFDGRFVYYVAYGHGTMLRYDTRLPFGAPSSWEAYDAAMTGGLDTGGFDGGFFDGRYIVFVPWIRTVKEGENRNRVHTNFLRYDTQGLFADPKSWDSYDAGFTDGIVSKGYNAGAFDGRFFYGAPMYDGESAELHGRVLRFDTTGSNATFSLRFCDVGHNGGLCAAVPGPGFLVNTENGALGAAAHRIPAPGWHHFAGVYDGAEIRLYIDGVLAARREGSGALINSPADVEVGRIRKGAARFRGIVGEIRISDTARDADWLATAYENLRDPAGFVNILK